MIEKKGSIESHARFDRCRDFGKGLADGFIISRMMTRIHAEIRRKNVVIISIRFDEPIK